MELFLQFGHGMKALTIDLAKKWGEASVILSPRDMTPKQLELWTKDFEKNNINTYFDPQCYCPMGNQKRLIQYKYWDMHLNTNLQSAYTPIDEKIIAIKKYNDIAKTKEYILPAILNNYNEEWTDRFFSQSQRFIESARRFMDDKPIIATLALPKDFLIQNETTIGYVLEEIVEWNVDGFYVIAEALDEKYLIANPMWISNVLFICATLKIFGKKVIYGYGNHQLLPLALSKVDAMASGTWLNVRSFTNRFIDKDEQKRKSTWVYYPEGLSEYKLSFLDWAFNIGKLEKMRSEDKEFLDEGIDKIFKSTATPSTTSFSETDAFKHYLCCLRHQIELLDKPSYKEAFVGYEMLLTTAERRIEELEEFGVYAQTRSFKNFIDINRAAISRLDKTCGDKLNFSWKTL